VVGPFGPVVDLSFLDKDWYIKVIRDLSLDRTSSKPHYLRVTTSLLIEKLREYRKADAHHHPRPCYTCQSTKRWLRAQPEKEIAEEFFIISRTTGQARVEILKTVSLSTTNNELLDFYSPVTMKN
jgi:hypothetical protein